MDKSVISINNIDLASLTGFLDHSYRKFKQNVYYSQNFAYMNYKIAAFEDYQIENVFKTLSNVIKTKDDKYIDSLVNQIGVVVLPKKTKDKNKLNKKSVYSYYPKNKITIEEVNFYIDYPVEIGIIDTFLSVYISFFLNVNEKCRSCYANLIEEGKNLEETFKRHQLFKMYFHKYQDWKETAIRKAQSISQKEHKNCTIFTIDLKRYYYSTDINIIDLLKKNLEYDLSDPLLNWLIDIFQRIFVKFSNLVREYFPFIKNRTILPIGLSLSPILANVYLCDFDKEMEKHCEVYTRYVDDVLFVLKNKSKNFGEYVKNNPTLFNKIKKNKYRITMHPECEITEEKLRMIIVDKNSNNTFFDKMRYESFNASESRLFPNYKMSINSLLPDLLEKEEYIKFRDAEPCTIDVKHLNNNLRGYLSERIGTNNSIEKSTVSAFVSEFAKTLRDDDLLLMFGRWSKLVSYFELISNNDNDVTKPFYESLDRVIENSSISSSNDEYKNIDSLNKLIKHTLDVFYDNALNMFYALKGIELENEKRNKIIKSYRFTNLMQLDNVGFPMVNYLEKVSFKCDFTNSDADYYSNLFTNKFDTHKLKYSPVFIHLFNYALFAQLRNIVSGNYNDIELIVNDYVKLILEIDKGFENISFSGKQDKNLDGTKIENNLFSIQHVAVNNKKPGENKQRNVFLGVASVNLSMLNILNDNGSNNYTINFSNPNINAKREILRLLKDTISLDALNYRYKANKKISQNLLKQNTEFNNKFPMDFVLFPESFLPLNWAYMMDKFSKESFSILITGLRHIKYKNKNNNTDYAFNLILTCLPFFDNEKHRIVLPLLREKNFYPLYEKEIIKNSGYLVSDKNYYTYYVIDYDDIKFAPIICYEATDIESRAELKKVNNINFILCSENNKDVSYFNSIGVSTSRELYCFYVESNSSEYGSSSFGPYGSKFSQISSDKGSLKSHMHILTVDIDSLKKEKNCYLDEYENLRHFSEKPKEETKKYRKPSANNRK